MGRVTYQGMAQYFLTAPADYPYAKFMNETAKVVFSRTLTTADWTNSTIASGDTASEIDQQRRQGDGEIMAHGGVSFVQSLIRLDLVDEYRLTIFPFLAGTGKQLFADVVKPRQLGLVSCTGFGKGCVGLVYRRHPSES